MSVTSILTEEPAAIDPAYDTPAYRLKLAAALDKASSLQSMDSDKTYCRVLISPDALHAIVAALRGV
jgi:hypothetical protein